MENSIYENSDSDKDIDLSLNCSVDQSFRLNNTLIEKKDSNNEKDEKVSCLIINYLINKNYEEYEYNFNLSFT